MPTWNDHPVAVVRKPRNKKIYMRYQDGALVVTAPSFITDEQIRQFLFDNKEWIERQEKKQANTALREGGFLYLFGERYGLKKGESTRIENGTLFYTDETAWKLHAGQALYLSQCESRFRPARMCRGDYPARALPSGTSGSFQGVLRRHPSKDARLRRENGPLKRYRDPAFLGIFSFVSFVDIKFYKLSTWGGVFRRNEKRKKQKARRKKTRKEKDLSCQVFVFSLFVPAQSL